MRFWVELIFFELETNRLDLDLIIFHFYAVIITITNNRELRTIYEDPSPGKSKIFKLLGHMQRRGKYQIINIF